MGASDGFRTIPWLKYNQMSCFHLYLEMHSTSFYLAVFHMTVYDMPGALTTV